MMMNDHIIRLVENNGKDFASIKISAEKILPTDTILNGKLVDELKFFDFMKETVEEWGIKNRNVRFHAPRELNILREVDIPKTVKKDEIKKYITMEIGNTIHFPFKNPVFNVYDIIETDTVNKVTVVATPEEEIIKYTEIFEDVKLIPIAVDAQSLSVYRFFLNQEQPEDKAIYLFLELNLTSVNISIFRNHKAEFSRFQSLNVTIQDWQPNENVQPIQWTYTGDERRLYNEVEGQLNDIDNLMNFYRFSIHQGEKSVTNIILLGEYPDLEDIELRLQNLYNIPVTTLKVDQSEIETISPVFIPALGLALKGEI